ncbi:arylamine N-acetyltransferase [Hydra vulgaris]|uniref:arylamine N-acetyltransferase n=1 Tax=Hydra vulgaris TaxID=6087 RepID=UPI001F5E603C|nr:arylamine N-acetyltransferase-like [Hydra vulgaris]
MTEFTFDKVLYLKSLQLTDYLDNVDAIKPSQSLLYDIVKKHSQVIPYQNSSLYGATSTLDLSIKSLQERLLLKKLGGMCYETSELLWHALNSFGFKAYRVPTVVLIGLPIDVDDIYTHNITTVFFEDRKFLIDVGFGYNSIKEPLPFSFLTTEEITVQGEKYILTCQADYYMLSMEYGVNELLNFYRFNKTVEFLPEVIDVNQTSSLYTTLINHPKLVVVRDRYILCGKTTELGRIGFIYDNKEKIFKKETFANNSVTKVFFKSKEEFERSIYEDLNISPDLSKICEV